MMLLMAAGLRELVFFIKYKWNNVKLVHTLIRFHVICLLARSCLSELQKTFVDMAICSLSLTSAPKK